MTQVTGILSPYLAKKRLKHILKSITKTSVDILDIGCGETEIPKIIQDKIKSYTGIDLLKSVIYKNKKTYPNHTFIYGNIFDIELPTQFSFDYIILSALIEHLEYSENLKLFRKLKPLLKSNGLIILTTPHKKTKKIHEIGARIGLFSKEASHEHKCFFTKKILEKLAKETGFKIKKYKTFQLTLNQICHYTHS